MLYALCRKPHGRNNIPMKVLLPARYRESDINIPTMVLGCVGTYYDLQYVKVGNT